MRVRASERASRLAVFIPRGAEVLLMAPDERRADRRREGGGCALCLCCDLILALELDSGKGGGARQAT